MALHQVPINGQPTWRAPRGMAAMPPVEQRMQEAEAASIIVPAGAANGPYSGPGSAPVGSAVRTSDLAATRAAGMMIKAAEAMPRDPS